MSKCRSAAIACSVIVAAGVFGAGVGQADPVEPEEDLGALTRAHKERIAARDAADAAALAKLQAEHRARVAAGDEAEAAALARQIAAHKAHIAAKEKAEAEELERLRDGQHPPER